MKFKLRDRTITFRASEELWEAMDKERKKLETDWSTYFIYLFDGRPR